MLVFIFILILPLYYLITFHGGTSNTTPSPQSYPFIGNLIGVLRNLHRFYDWAIDLATDAGRLTFRVNPFLGLPNIIIFTLDPANIQHILKSNFQNYIKGSRFRDNLHDLLGDGIFTVDGHLWSLQRKIASHEFNTRSLKSFISHTVQCEISTRLLPLLSEACARDEIIDLQPVFQKFGFDNICNLAFDFDPACLGDAISPGYSFASSFDDATDICMSRLLLPLPVIWKFKRLLSIGSEKRLKEAIRTIDRFAIEIIRSKEEKLKSPVSSVNSEDKLDLLSRFMRSNVELEFKTPEERMKFYRDIIVSFILAGKDSTSVALTWFFWLLSGHRQCERRIYDEISAATTASFDGERNLNYDDLKSFNYLHAALSESLRLFPPVPGNSRLTVNDDTLPDGTQIRRGWAVDYSVYAMGRMEKVWGSDCLEFRPERWLDEEGNFQACEQFKYPVFHGGPRICLGKDMAYVQMKAVVVAMLDHFEVVAVDGGASPEKMKNPPYQVGLVLKKRDGLEVKLVFTHVTVFLLACSVVLVWPPLWFHHHQTLLIFLWNFGSLIPYKDTESKAPKPNTQFRRLNPSSISNFHFLFNQSRCFRFRSNSSSTCVPSSSNSSSTWL